jgi:hypothetical protein
MSDENYGSSAGACVFVPFFQYCELGCISAYGLGHSVLGIVGSVPVLDTYVKCWTKI